MHGWVVRNLRRSTRFWVRHRHSGERHIELTDIAVPFTPRRPDPPVRPVRTLLWLGVPGLLVAFFGADRLFHGSDTMVGSAVTVVFLALSLVFVLRAAHARAPRWIRAVGIACGVVFPVLWILVRLGAIG
ncbi:MAG: hypothetical protein ACYTF8_03410 [Planctomycetota bacterium]|jgi:hypothetical protein